MSKKDKCKKESWFPSFGFFIMLILSIVIALLIVLFLVALYLKDLKICFTGKFIPEKIIK